MPSGNEEDSDDYDPFKNGHSSTFSPRPRVLPLAEEVGGSTSVPVRVPELKRGVLERGTARLNLLELDRTVIQFN